MLPLAGLGLLAVVVVIVGAVVLPGLIGGGGDAMPTEPPAAPTRAAAEPTEAVEPIGALAEPRIGLVTDVGRVDDGTFNELAHRGARQASQEFGLDYKYIETQAHADYEGNIQILVDEGFDVIVTVGFLIQEATAAAAAANPDIIFIGVDQHFEPGTVTDNLVGLQFRGDQAGFLAGALAAMVSESGTIGTVAGLEIPPVKGRKNGYENGARYVRPDINLLSVYVPTFVDPALGASTAEQMIGEGADVIFGVGGPTGSGAIAAAAERGVYVIGIDQDEYVTTFDNGNAPGADRILSSAMLRVDVAVYEELKAVVEGTFEGNGIAVFDAADDGVGLADFHEAADAVTPAMQARLNEIITALADGSLNTGVDPDSGDLIESEIPEPWPFEP